MGLLTGGWIPSVSDGNQWIQVNMTSPYRFQKILTQGQQDAPYWVTSYHILYSDDAVTFVTYSDENGTNVSARLKGYTLYIYGEYRRFYVTMVKVLSGII